MYACLPTKQNSDVAGGDDYRQFPETKQHFSSVMRYKETHDKTIQANAALYLLHMRFIGYVDSILMKALPHS